jgi:hypothetical protein
MEQKNNRQAALFEHRFWLQILGDHARFMLDTLAAKELKALQQAERFKDVFDQLLELARQDVQDTELARLNQSAYEQALQFRAFKLHLLQLNVMGELSIGLSPTFINHMVNELEEYLRVLDSLVLGKKPPSFSALHHHLLWLSDAYGHAFSIAAELDLVEQRLIAQSQQFARHFQEFYIKAVEMVGYTRARLHQFPALSRFNRQVEMELALFRHFLREIEEMELDAEALGTLSPLIPDHMAREECYYLSKLAQVSEVSAPDCDPGKPRTGQ